MTAPEPAVQFSNLLLKIVLSTLPVPASVLIQPAIVVAPLCVIFEKLLLLLVTTTPVLLVAVVLVNKVIAPEVAATFRTKPVTMLLLSTF